MATAKVHTALLMAAVNVLEAGISEHALQIAAALREAAGEAKMTLATAGSLEALAAA